MPDSKPLRIAILGSRGIPAEFGGFETFAEQLAVRLVERGDRVTVFCEKSQHFRGPHYKGVSLRYIYTPELSGLRSIWFDLVSILRTLRGYDVVYMLGYHAAFAFVLPYLLRTNFWVNMDGLEWRRSKWSKNAQRYLRAMEFLAARFARNLVADAQGIADYLASTYPTARDKTRVIEYGAFPVDTPPNADSLTRFNLEPQEYFLVVCRLEPENHVREIVEGFLASDSPRRLLIVGDHTTGTDYVRTLLATADKQVQFAGTVFDQRVLTALRYHCRTYVHGHSVGGTNPSLLEAMACGNYVIAHDNVFNREVTQNLCRYFSTSEDLAARLNEIEREGIPGDVCARLKAKVRCYYDWGMIVERYHSAFTAPLNGSSGAPR